MDLGLGIVLLCYICSGFVYAFATTSDIYNRLTYFGFDLDHPFISIMLTVLIFIVTMATWPLVWAARNARGDQC